MTILVIAPHADDEVIGCGGTIAHHVAAGDTVHVLVMTRGVPTKFSPEVMERIRAEARNAHALLGVHQTIFFDFPAPMLDTVPSCDLAEAIGKVIRDSAPVVVYLPHRGDVHGDHRCVFQAAMVALRPLASSPVRRVLSYETLSSTEWGVPGPESAFIPTCFVDITAFLETKIAALAQYDSQLHPAPHPRSKEALRSLAGYRGTSVGLMAAEAFMLVREIIG